MKTLDKVVEFFGWEKRIEQAERKLDKTKRQRRYARGLGALLILLLALFGTLVAVQIEEHRLSEGVTHENRVNLLRTLDDINR